MLWSQQLKFELEVEFKFEMELENVSWGRIYRLINASSTLRWMKYLLGIKGTFHDLQCNSVQ